MIDYKPFWETLKQSEETTYTLVTRHRISGATIDKLRKNKPVNTTTLDGLCGIFECALQDIVRYVPDGKENGSAMADADRDTVPVPGVRHREEKRKEKEAISGTAGRE